MFQRCELLQAVNFRTCRIFPASHLWDAREYPRIHADSILWILSNGANPCILSNELFVIAICWQ